MSLLLPTILICAILAHTLNAEEVDGPRPLTKPLFETAKDHQGTNILIIFTASWDSNGLILEKWMKEKSIVKVMQSKDIASYVADCTKGDSAGAVEMRRHGVHGVPPSAALLHSDGMITFKSLILHSPERLAGDLTALIQKAQQGVAPQSATRPESDSEGGDKHQHESEPRPR